MAKRTSAAAHHAMFTPRTPVTTSRKMYSHSPLGAVGSTTTETVDALGYYFENSVNTELSPDASPEAVLIKQEISSVWKLMVEMLRMEALSDRLVETTNPRSSMVLDDSNASESSSGIASSKLREGFTACSWFRRLMAMIRWLHWVNRQRKEENNRGGKLQPSNCAYPLTGEGVLIDSSLRAPETVHKSDIAREKELCKQLWWNYIVEGRLLEGIEFCVSSGHHWRAGVLHAACGHEYLLGEEEGDWVEAELLGPLFDYGSTEQARARWETKRVAKTVVEEDLLQDAEETAFMGFLCGDLEVDKRRSPHYNLWARLVCLKEQFAAWLVWGAEGTAAYECLFGVFSGVTSLKEGEKILIREILHALDEIDNDFFEMQSAIVQGSWTDGGSSIQLSSRPVTQIILGWIEEGFARLGPTTDVNIDLYSPEVDQVSIMLVRAFGCGFVTMLGDLQAAIGDGTEGDYKALSASTVNTIVSCYVECLIAQCRSYESLEDLAGYNAIIVETIGLVVDASDLSCRCVKLDLWSKYISNINRLIKAEFVRSPSTEFPPLLSLLECFPEGALAVIKKSIAGLVGDSGACSSEVSSEIAFYGAFANWFWLLVQSAAKSSGHGIYVDVAGRNEETDNDREEESYAMSPDESAAELVKTLGTVIGELGVVCLRFGESQVAQWLLTELPSREKPYRTAGGLIQLESALESVQQPASSLWDQNLFFVVRAIWALQDRSAALGARVALLEQQKAQLVHVSGRATAGGARSDAMSMGTRRQTVEIQRMINSTQELVRKAVGELVGGFVELCCVKNFALNEEYSVCKIACWKRIVLEVVDMTLIETIEAVETADKFNEDQELMEKVVSALKMAKWISLFPKVNQLIEQVLANK